MVLAGLLVIGMVSPLFAADIKVTGQVRTRYRFWSNLSLNNDKNFDQGERHYFDNRIRFGADAKLSEGVRARIELERYDNFGTRPPNVNNNNPPGIRQAWMDFQIPGLPEGWRTQLGRSFFAVGHQFVYGNSLTGNDGISVYGPLGPGTLKFYFSQTNGGAVCCLGETAGGGVTYEMLAYKFEVAPKHTLEVYGIASQDKGIAGITTTAATNTTGPTAEEFWGGGAYSGAFGPVALRAEGAYQGGTARNDAAGGDIDRKAGFVWIDATYKVIPEWSLGIDISYATGDDNPNDQDFSNFVSPLASFTTSPTRVWTDSGFFNGNRSARFIGNNTTNRFYNFWGRGTSDSDLTAGAAIDNNNNLFSPGLIELKFHTKYAFNPEVTGFLNIIPTWADKNPTGISKYMGTEIDLKVAYKPYPNIVTNMYFGYFIVGDFFKQEGARAATTGTAKDPDDALVFRAEAVVTF
jgi:hypothetical protein